jgi:acyl-CoA dehydrogenase
MTTSAALISSRPRPTREGDDRFVSLAAELGEQFAPYAAEHDLKNTFVARNFEILKSSGYTGLAVPAELGGLGASMRQVCCAQAELARYCAATALAVNMHIYSSLTQVYRWRHGVAAAEGVLRRVAADGLILMTSGGSDGLWPSGTAEKVEGGFRVTGTKAFCSQAPVADVLGTLVPFDDPDEGRVVLALGIPMSSEGVQIVETWDTLGMRGTSSHDVQLDNVFVADGQVAARRPWGRWDAVFYNAILHFDPTTSAVYYGIAAGARDEAVRSVLSRTAGDGRPLAEEPTIQRLVGLMDYKLRTSWWALMGALDELGDDYPLDAAMATTVLLARRQVVTEAVEIVDLAMEAAGGASYYRRSPLERAYRDVRAGKYHPLPPEKTLWYAGRYGLGLQVDDIW